MKCPKCGYLGFESSDRCRNCGYEFSLSAGKSDPLDLALDLGPDESRPPFDLDRVIGGPDTAPAADLPLFPPSQADLHVRPASSKPAEASAAGGRREDAPLLNAPVRPRAPLGVRRATPEVPRARSRETRPLTHADMLFETPPARQAFEGARSGPGGASGDALAGASSRILAGLVDVALLSALDASVLYFTLRLLGLTSAQYLELPLIPLVAFLLLLNGGYFIAFTAVGGQSIGKMALGIKVISQEESAVPIGRATLRTLAYLVSALPLGAGFLPGVMSADRLALHDRLAHTRVVRPSST
jgi:uncharacterized RDD family membrane protein YckC